jgi:hypothetical protein
MHTHPTIGAGLDVVYQVTDASPLIPSGSPRSQIGHVFTGRGRLQVISPIPPPSYDLRGED